MSLTPEEIKSLFLSAVDTVAASIRDYARNPEKDFTRSRKLPVQKLIPFLVAEGSSSTRNELLDFFGPDVSRPSAPAFTQQREKLLPAALESVLRNFNALIDSKSTQAQYRLLAADGSTATFPSRPGLSSDEYFMDQGHSAKGFYSVHINALYDLNTHTYADAFLQPVHKKDEFRAFCTMVDRMPCSKDSKNIYIGDRGYCSYNNMAHVIEAEQFFLFRTKDIHSKGLVGNFDFPDEESFDLTVNVTLTRSHSSKIIVREGYRRFIDQASSFDFIEYGSADTYHLSFRIVRFPLSEGTYECLVTNLPRDEFPPEKLKAFYFSRWAIETSFRKLKYTIGLSNFHACKAEFVKQEIWARLITYNITELLVNQAVVEKRNDTKHEYRINFTTAAHLCRMFLRLSTEERAINVTALLLKELVPIRNDRQFTRLKTAHFRKPRYFTYRAA